MKFFSNYPLVLLPGTGCNALLWRRLLPLLPKSITPVILNLLSCTSQQAMLQTINELPYKKFALLGFSMGGYLAQHFYAMHPERVSHLMLLCTSGEKRKTNAAQIQRNLDHLTDESYLSQMIDSTSLEKNQELYTQLITMLNEVGAEVIKRQMHATQQRYSVLDQFPDQPVPTLIVGARYDKLVVQSHTERLASALKSNVTWIDSGHMLPMEAPDELGGLLSHWLNKQSLNLFSIRKWRVEGTENIKGLQE